MGLKDKITNFWGRKKQNDSDNISLTDINVGSLMIGGSSQGVSVKKAMEKYTGWVYNALKPLSKDVAKINFRLMQTKRDGTEEELHDHELLNLLNAVNQHMTKYELIATTTIHLGLVGNAYWLLYGAEKEGDQPQALYPLNPKYITIQRKGIPQFITGYKYEVPGEETQVFESHQIMHFREPNPNDPYHGMGTVQAIAHWVDMETKANENNRNLFENHSRPDAVLSTEEGYSESGRRLIRDSFDQKYSGSQNAYKTLMLPKGVKYEGISLSPKEMDFNQTLLNIRDSILAAFEVPRTRIGITEDVNRANAEATTYVYNKNAVEPYMELIRAYLNEFLVPIYGENLYLTFDSPVPEDAERKRNNYQAALAKQPYKTVNEVREEEGLPPVENGDEIRVNPNMAPLGKPQEQDQGNKKVNYPKNGGNGENQKKHKPSVRKIQFSKSAKKRKELSESLQREFEKALKQKKHETQSLLEEKGIANLSDDEYEEIHKQFVTRVSQYENQLRQEVRKINAQQLNEARNNLNEIMQKRQRRKDIDPDDLIDKEKWTEIMVKVSLPILQELSESEGKEAAKLLGFEESLGVLTEENKEAIQESTRRFAETYNETTANALSTALTQAQEEGASLPELQEELGQYYEFSDDVRAKRVARTETFRVGNAANKQVWKKTGVVKTIKWHTAADERVCEFCNPMHGKVIDIDGKFFEYGEDIPGEQGGTISADYTSIGNPPLHPYCRCGIRPENIEV